MRTAACFRGKLKNPPQISSKRQKDTGQGGLKGTVGMEALGNGLLVTLIMYLDFQSPRENEDMALSCTTLTHYSATKRRRRK